MSSNMQLMDQHVLEHLKAKKVTPVSLFRGHLLVLEHLKAKKVTPEEAYRCCNDKKHFEQYLPKQAPGAPQP